MRSLGYRAEGAAVCFSFTHYAVFPNLAMSGFQAVLHGGTQSFSVSPTFINMTDIHYGALTSIYLAFEQSPMGRSRGREWVPLPQRLLMILTGDDKPDTGIFQYSIPTPVSPVYVPAARNPLDRVSIWRQGQS